MRWVGVDEAGRGSFLGPLVVGAFAIDSDGVDGLRAAGVRDSKILTPAARTACYDRLRTLGTMRSISLDPATIDGAVARHRLNDLEATAFGRILGGLHPDEARVDACDADPARFGARVRRAGGLTVPVRASHHADRDDPVVGAASIVAKVRRDRAIAALAARLGRPVGSGYPSDPETVAFVREWLAVHRQPPRWLRRSWATMGRVMPPPRARTLDRFDP